MKRKIKIKYEYCCLATARKNKTDIINGLVPSEVEVPDAMPKLHDGDYILINGQAISVENTAYVIEGDKMWEVITLKLVCEKHEKGYDDPEDDYDGILH